MADEKSNRQSPAMIGVDDGYAQVKVWTPDIRHIVPSSVRAGGHGLRSFDGSAVAPVYTTDGVQYTASDAVASEDTRLNGYHHSPLNRVAVHHALHGARVAGTVMLAVGLPIREFYVNGQPNKTAAAGKRNSFSIEVVPEGGAAITIAGIRVFPQAIAAWADYIFTDDLKMAPQVDAKAPVAIVDVGGRTTDIAVILNASIDHARSGTINEGVLNIRDAIQSFAREHFDVAQDLPPTVLSAAMHNRRTLRVYGKEQDVSACIDTAIAELAEKVTRFTQRNVGNGADLEKVIFVGGGASFLSPLISKFQNAAVAKDPEFANARGLWKFGRNRDLKDRA